MIEISYNEKGVDLKTSRKHSHSNYEIFISKSEGGTFVVRDKAYPLVANAIYFIDSFTFHYSNPFDTDNYIRTKIGFDNSFLMELNSLIDNIEDINSLFLNTVMVLPSKQDIKACDEALAKLSEDHNEHFTLNDLLIVLDIINIGIKNSSNTNISNTVIDAALRYIEQNYMHNITLDSISSTLFINKFYLCHIFKSITGMSIKQYLIEYRLSLAKKLLMETDESISNICNITGFNNTAYFSKIFREFENCSPTQYRKLMRNTDR